ncbi:archaellin/type IV pilin N-terminal domain-containing protein [Halorientalis marina]|uniref:archaellin/type IV pilin N-terminal domain-containing protein n=1 Tax=Halorientalis marina TaxID=2931976 RepID=UPI001FF3CD0D|nr:archaellin/type IV pilin N-terminal domain-containing protein [Halorientalis marina]
MFDNENNDSERGQVGIGTLIVFIAMVLVAAIAAGVLINTAGFLQSQSEETGQQSSQQVTNRLQVQTATGLVTGADADNTVGAVELIATKAPGAEDIDLTGVSIQWVDDTGTYDIVHDKAFDNQDGAFDHIPVKDEDDSLDDQDSAPVINSPDDRARLIFDIGESDVADSNNGDFVDTDGSIIVRAEQGTDQALWNDANPGYSGSGDSPSSTLSDLNEHTFRPDENGEAPPNEGMQEGATARLRITTQSGATSTVRLTVPTSLSGSSAAQL